jgi:hypothetical protein
MGEASLSVLILSIRTCCGNSDYAFGYFLFLAALAGIWKRSACQLSLESTGQYIPHEREVSDVVIPRRSNGSIVIKCQIGKSDVGANGRTVEYAGGGAALGAIIGPIAGGGKGAAIGAGAGAGAGAITQIMTKGGSIRVPAESVLTFSLDKMLKVSAAE